MSQDKSQDIEKLAACLEECQMEEKESFGVVLSDTHDSCVLAKFPTPKLKVPPVFLHKPVKFGPLMRKVLNLGIKFYRPVIGNHYTKICCQSLDDQKALIQYFMNKQLPHHTYGHPGKRKMKVVFRGLPNDVDLGLFKKNLKSVSIPIIRVHKMQNNECAKYLLVLAVVPNNEEGRKILRVQKYFGHNVKIEPPNPRSRQCYRCQKWGHSQRYCKGQIKCVKCGDGHLSQKCTKDPKHPAKCANCNSDHTANYKLCPFSPYSPQYEKKISATTIQKSMFPDIQDMPRKLITIQNYQLFLRGRL